jgi:rhodanese-related sulfurtransferase
VAHQRAGSPLAAANPPQDAAQLEESFASLADALAAGYALIDVRDMKERDAEPVPASSLHLPMTKLLTEAVNLDLDGQYLLLCATGKRSGAAAELLRSQGFRACRCCAADSGSESHRLKRACRCCLLSSRCAGGGPGGEKQRAERDHVHAPAARSRPRARSGAYP